MEQCRLNWHRAYVGGLWNVIGRLQFEFLKARGLKPHHYLLDVACGSLRAGVHFVPYLEPERYLGIDRNAKLVQAGLDQEIGAELAAAKRPQLVVSEEFEFEKFGVRADFALAQSLFTHLTPERIVTCLRKLHAGLKDDGVFYATFNEAAVPQQNPTEPHDHRVFRYTRGEMEDLARETGWSVRYIGDWGHPRGQKMLELHPSLKPASISEAAADARPNLLLLGVGHSGTSVTARMLGLLGWNLGDADGFAEHVGIRRLNGALLAGRTIAPGQLAATLSELPTPWVVKDPRFVLTLRHWLPALEQLPPPHQPTLLYLTRDIAKVRRTYAAYGEMAAGAPGMYGRTAEQLAELAEQAYRHWPLPKLRLRFEQIIAAAKAFHIGRAERRDGDR